MNAATHLPNFRPPILCGESLPGGGTRARENVPLPRPALRPRLYPDAWPRSCSACGRADIHESQQSHSLIDPGGGRASRGIADALGCVREHRGACAPGERGLRNSRARGSSYSYPSCESRGQRSRGELPQRSRPRVAGRRGGARTWPCEGEVGHADRWICVGGEVSRERCSRCLAAELPSMRRPPRMLSACTRCTSRGPAPTGSP